MPKWGFPDLVSSSPPLVWSTSRQQKPFVGPHADIITSLLASTHHSPLTTRHRNFQQYRTGFSSRRPPARRAPSPSRCGSTSAALYRGKRRMRQARGQRRPPSHTHPATRGVDGGRRGGRGGQKGVDGDASRRLADARCNLCNTCDGGIIIVAVPSSRQGLLLLPSHHSPRRIHRGSLPLFVARTWLDV